MRAGRDGAGGMGLVGRTQWHARGGTRAGTRACIGCGAEPPPYHAQPPSFGLLSARGLVFDTHANWFQLRDAAAFFASQPRTAIVVDHLGCPKLSGAPADDAVIAEWKAGMGALARDVPASRVKISGLEYVLAGWAAPHSAARATVHGLVHWVLDTFGADRCMVASNFPVDHHMSGDDLPALYAALYDLLKTRPSGERTPESDLRKVFHDTAVETYGLEKLRK